MQLSNQIIALIQDILQPTPTPQEGEASGGQVEKTDRPGSDLSLCDVHEKVKTHYMVMYCALFLSYHAHRTLSYIL